jgi:hypothetical protein
MLIVAGLFMALEIYVAYMSFTEWFARKWKLFKLGINLIIKGDSKLVKGIGWATLRLVLWESKDDDKCSTDKDKE